jgi:hypothetical protein
MKNLTNISSVSSYYEGYEYEITRSRTVMFLS